MLREKTDLAARPLEAISEPTLVILSPDIDRGFLNGRLII